MRWKHSASESNPVSPWSGLQKRFEINSFPTLKLCAIRSVGAHLRRTDPWHTQYAGRTGATLPRRSHARRLHQVHRPNHGACWCEPRDHSCARGLDVVSLFVASYARQAKANRDFGPWSRFVCTAGLSRQRPRSRTVKRAADCFCANSRF